MEKEIVDLEQKRIEQALSQIGASIADASDLSKQSGDILNEVQREIEALYLSLAKE